MFGLTPLVLTLTCAPDGQTTRSLCHLASTRRSWPATVVTHSEAIVAQLVGAGVQTTEIRLLQPRVEPSRLDAAQRQLIRRSWALESKRAKVIALLSAPPQVADTLAAIMAVGLDLVWGYTGILSLCQAFFFSLGGYAMGMYLAHHGGQAAHQLFDRPAPFHDKVLVGVHREDSPGKVGRFFHGPSIGEQAFLLQPLHRWADQLGLELHHRQRAIFHPLKVRVALGLRSFQPHIASTRQALRGSPS